MYQQTHRFLTVTTPLGPDHLLLESFEGTEALSRPFEFQLDLLSSTDAIDLRELLGRAIGFSVHADDEPLRSFHGIVRSLARGELTDDGLRRYRAHVVPHVWALSKRSDCRIFQGDTVLEIVSRVLEEAGVTDFEVSGVRSDPPPLEYCVQYNESDLDFVSRLLEEHGIFYTFRHEPGRHVMVLADGTWAYHECAGEPVPFSQGSLVPDHVHRWDHRIELVSGHWTHADYNFETPQVSLIADCPSILPSPISGRFERYSFPGRHDSRDIGESKARIAMEAEEVRHETVDGASNCPFLTVAGTFELDASTHEFESTGPVVITSLTHGARDDSYSQHGSSDTHYANRFQAIPAARTFRPARRTAVPRIPGPQTAVVVGRPGEEVDTDEYGRVRVQFHWDRRGQRDHRSSCWLRVSNPWAQKKWGMVTLPRIGQEVVVEFLDGDPDRPLVTGCVFNADNMPPYDLPENRTRTGFKSRSTGSGPDSFSELRFEDRKDQEEVYLQSQRDFNSLVKNDSRSTIQGNDHRSVGGDQTNQVAGSRTTGIQGDLTESVAGGSATHVGGDAAESIGGSKVIDAGASLVLSAGTSITLKCGASTLHMNQAGVISVSGMMVSVSGTALANVAAPITSVAGGLVLSSSGVMNLVSGAVTKVSGSSLVQAQGGKAALEASGECIVKGGEVKLN